MLRFGDLNLYFALGLSYNLVLQSVVGFRFVVRWNMLLEFSGYLGFSLFFKAFTVANTVLLLVMDETE